MKATVEYRPVPGHLNYRVGDDGSVWSRARGEWKQLSPYGSAQPTVTLSGRVKMSVARIVLLAFVGECPKGMRGRNINRNTDDCRLSNLKYLSRKESQRDVPPPPPMPGEDNPQHKLTSDNVMEVLALIDQGIPQRAVARRFDVSKNCVYQIIHGIKWGWLTGRKLEQKAVA
jgi:hypothetical protein